MKRWAFLTVGLYALALVALTAPALLLAFGNWWGHPKSGGMEAAQAFVIYREWGYWVWLAVMAAGQLLLLVVPVDISRRRLVPRRKLLVPIITSAFLLANVAFGAAFALGCAIFNDTAWDFPEIFGARDSQQTIGFILLMAALWAFWGIVFYRASRRYEPADAAARIMRWLLKGSILELLVAVPSHVIVRQRETCCAPAGSFWGIATGLSVMFLCYGPGVFFLFAERFARKRPSIDSSPPQR